MKYRSHAIQYRDSGALLREGGKEGRGEGGFPTEPGQSGLAIGSALAGVIQSFLRFALIPHLTKHAAVHVPGLCLSGHLDIHLVSVSVNITARWTCINNSRLTCQRHEPPTPTLWPLLRLLWLAAVECSE